MQDRVKFNNLLEVVDRSSESSWSKSCSLQNWFNNKLERVFANGLSDLMELWLNHLAEFCLDNLTEFHLDRSTEFCLDTLMDRTTEFHLNHLMEFCDLMLSLRNWNKINSGLGSQSPSNERNNQMKLGFGVSRHHNCWVVLDAVQQKKFDASRHCDPICWIILDTKQQKILSV